MESAPVNAKILVIDDEEANCRLVKAIFSVEGFQVIAAHDGAAGLAMLAAESPDLVLVDLRMPGMSGMDVLQDLRIRAPSLPAVMLTGSRDVKNAVRATQLGAIDYLTKPINRDELVLVVRRALETSALRREVEELRRRVDVDELDPLVMQMGMSQEVARVVEQVKLVASSNFTVLVMGETGTGKELVARAIHEQSDRRRKPFVALDCGAIPEQLMESELFGHERGAFTGADRRKEGRFRLAEGGTCFLDEVGNLPVTLQPKLLRVLESKQVQAVGAERSQPMDVRFIAATNDSLQQRIALGQFRADLYFRLAQYTIQVPPLRERRVDIPHLTQRFVDAVSVELRKPVQAILPEALELLQQNDWPGNVRELQNVVRKAVLQTKGLAIRAETIQAALGEDASAPVPAQPAPVETRSLREIAAAAVQTAERTAICAVLQASGGNKARAARELRTDYKTLHVKMKQLGIRARDYGN
jgi:DNA-binding NtrC family response regulator